jgi:hypothetical protein
LRFDAVAVSETMSAIGPNVPNAAATKKSSEAWARLMMIVTAAAHSNVSGTKHISHSSISTGREIPPFEFSIASTLS